MMKKQILAMILSLTVFCTAGSFSFAQETATVSFTQDKKLEYSGVTEEEGHVNLGDAFQNVVPGETRVQTITLKNENERTADFYMSSEAVKALEEGKANAQGAGYEVKLTVGAPGAAESDLTVLYDSALGGYKDAATASKEGIKGMNESLEDFILLGTMKKGESKEIKLSIHFDGEAMDNSGNADYSLTQGQLAFEFQVGYEDPTGITRIVREVDNEGNVRYVRKLVEVFEEGVPLGAVATGDGAMIGVGLAVLAAGIILVILGKKKKVEEEA
ncbi:MAG: hypothetical protein IKL51_03920 [Lachnospiraceae bacterium]|nr:hypothetical protein [Lachnospiraceae bacterium]